MQLYKSVKVPVFINSYLLMIRTLRLPSTKHNAATVPNWFLDVRIMQFLKVKLLQREADFSQCGHLVFLSSEHTE